MGFGKGVEGCPPSDTSPQQAAIAHAGQVCRYRRLREAEVFNQVCHAVLPKEQVLSDNETIGL